MADTFSRSSSFEVLSPRPGGVSEPMTESSFSISKLFELTPHATVQQYAEQHSGEPNSNRSKQARFFAIKHGLFNWLRQQWAATSRNKIVIFFSFVCLAIAMFICISQINQTEGHETRIVSMSKELASVREDNARIRRENEELVKQAQEHKTHIATMTEELYSVRDDNIRIEKQSREQVDEAEAIQKRSDSLTKELVTALVKLAIDKYGLLEKEIEEPLAEQRESESHDFRYEIPPGALRRVVSTVIILLVTRGVARLIMRSRAEENQLTLFISICASVYYCVTMSQRGSSALDGDTCFLLTVISFFLLWRDSTPNPKAFAQQQKGVLQLENTAPAPVRRA